MTYFLKRFSIYRTYLLNKIIASSTRNYYKFLFGVALQKINHFKKENVLQRFTPDKINAIVRKFTTCVKLNTSKPIQEEYSNNIKQNGFELVAYFNSFVSYSPKNPTKPKFWEDFRPYCGEDAFFICNGKVSCIGIADGVGGWALVGVDPSKFAWQLMDNCKEEVKNGISSPKEILKNAYEKIIQQQQVKAGSSTACILTLSDGDPIKGIAILSSANIGDSGFLIIRDGKLLFRSKEQTHAFNTPFQLSVLPPGASDSHFQDLPNDADEMKMIVKHDDIVVLATDGLFDNLFDSEIVSIINENTNDLKKATENLLSIAHARARTLDCDTPFARAAMKNFRRWRGGKIDDITIIVAKIEIKGFKNQKFFIRSKL